MSSITQFSTVDNPCRSGISRLIQSIYGKLKEEWTTMNFFKNETLRSRQMYSQKIVLVSSRIYVVILILAVMALILFNSVTNVTISASIETPTLATFEELQGAYPSTLSCPCQSVAVPYSSFLSVTPIYHQVCSSDIISTKWITSLYGYGPLANNYLQLDRPILSKQHQILAKLCSDINELVTSTILTLNQSMLVTASAISRAAFESRTKVSLAQLGPAATDNFHRTFSFMIDLIRGSLVPTTFNTDWLLEYRNASSSYLLRSVPRTFRNSTCNCLISETCQEPLQVGPPDVVLPGLYVGCLPIDGLRISTLACFYSSSCIATIVNFLEYYTQSDGSPPVNFTIPEVPSISIIALNSSVPSRFPLNTQISTLINNLFIERWSNTSVYENYFAICSPKVCRYQYVARNNFLYVVTSLLSLYGGLTVALRFIIWNALRIYQRIKTRLRTRHTMVEPFNAMSTTNANGQ